MSEPSATPLVARDLAKTYADRVVLDGLDLTANPTHPLGVVGENGAGKSTLLRLLAGVEEPDAGSLSTPPDLAHLPQEPAFRAGVSVGDVLEHALTPMRRSVARVEELAEALARDAGPAAAAAYDDALAACTSHDAWSAGHRAQEAAALLGLAELDRGRPVASLSGGERSRLALAALVVRRPTCLLLDEPTNHLDDRALGFLEDHLRQLPGVVVVASHDRTFLDAVCADLLDLDDSALGLGGPDGRGGRTFHGGFTDYLAAKRAARVRWEQTHLVQQEELSRLRAGVRVVPGDVAHGRPPRDNDRFVYGFKGARVERTVSRRIAEDRRRLTVAEEAQLPEPPRLLRLRSGLTDDAARARPCSVRLAELAVAGRLRPCTLDLEPGGHLLVTGPNGSGKSTLLRVLAGLVPPTSGECQVSSRRVGLLPQDVRFAQPRRAALRVYADATAGAGAAEHPEPAVPLRELGLLAARDLVRPVGALSLGQQRRLALAVLVAGRHDLVLLDEPTNHLSLTLADELERALAVSPVTVVVASHDRWLPSRWTGPTLALD